MKPRKKMGRTLPGRLGAARGLKSPGPDRQPPWLQHCLPAPTGPLVLRCRLISPRPSGLGHEEAGGRTYKGEVGVGQTSLPHAPSLRPSLHLSLWVLLHSSTHYLVLPHPWDTVGSKAVAIQYQLHLTAPTHPSTFQLLQLDCKRHF